MCDTKNNYLCSVLQCTVVHTCNYVLLLLIICDSIILIELMCKSQGVVDLYTIYRLAEQ